MQYVQKDDSFRIVCNKLLRKNQHSKNCNNIGQKNKVQLKETKKYESVVQKDDRNRQKNQSFRIKKIGNIQEKNIKQQTQQIIQKKITYDQKIPQRTFFQTEKENIYRNTQQIYKRQSPNDISQTRSIQNVQEIQQIRQLMNQPSQSNLIQIQQNQNHQQHLSNSPQLIIQDVHNNQQQIQSNVQNNNIQQIPQLQPNQIPANNQHNAINNNQPNNNPNNNNNNIRSLLINTQQIQGLINRSFLRQNQTIQVMIEQLRHLNLIANQVNEISVLGLHSQMGQVFAHRIRQLQSSLISQIGEAIIRNIHIDLSRFMPPEVPQGFTQQEIQQKFQPRINFRSQNVSCSICLVDLVQYERKIQLNCNHQFHPSCIIQWLKKKTTCPVCRTDQK